jgi:hypothetical protein
MEGVRDSCEVLRATNTYLGCANMQGTTKIKHLNDNVAAGKVHLDESERAIVAAAVPHEEVAGARYAGLATFVDQLETK